MPDAIHGDLQFDVPPGFEQIPGERYLSFAGPAGSSLAVSGSALVGSGSGRERTEALATMVENGLAAIQGILEEPGAVTTVPLTHRVLDGCEQWQLVVTLDGGTIFLGQLLAASRGGVLLATLEGPNDGNTARGFDAFIAGVRARSGA